MISKRLVGFGTAIVGVGALYLAFNPDIATSFFRKAEWFYNSFNDSSTRDDLKSKSYQSPATRPSDKELFPWEEEYQRRKRDNGTEDIRLRPVKALDVKLC